MKKISIKILATILVAILMIANFGFLSTVLAYPEKGDWSNAGYSSLNPYPETYTWNNEFHNGNCTWYCWGRAYEKLGVSLPSDLGDAGTWYSNAQNKGYEVGTEPRTDSIIVWSGHVAYVESWDGSNLYVSECNWDFRNNSSAHSYNERYCNDYYNGPGGVGNFIGFIYLKEVKPQDTEGPKISDVRVSKDQEGYTITCTVTDNVGVTRVQFPTVVKKADGTETEKFWGQGTIDGNTATFRMPYSHFGITDGTYVTQILANDAEENYSDVVTAVEFVPDVEAPVISNVKVTNVTGTSYTLTFEVDDNVGVTKVQCPTWNEDNDRDEMEGIDWGTDPAYTAIEKAGVYTYTVNIDNDTFKNEGGEYRTQITAYDEYGNVTKEDVNVDVYPVTDVTLNETEKTIYKGQELVLEATYEPIYTTGDTEIVWTSSDEEVATVEDGVVTALKEGTTTITAEVDGVKATCEITVEEIPLDGIVIEEQDVSLNVGEEKDLHVLFNPENTTDDKTVVWTSSDESVITISEDGKVKALKAGTATVTATVGDKTATTEITVNEEVKEGEESNSVLPKTGDVQVIALAIGMLVSVLGIAFIIKKNRK